MQQLLPSISSRLKSLQPKKEKETTLVSFQKQKEKQKRKQQLLPPIPSRPKSPEVKSP